jgi:hypothetical protein
MVKPEVRSFVGSRIDTRNWPLILWEMLPARTPDAELARALDHFVELMRITPAGTKNFAVTDLSMVSESPPASQRRVATDFVASHEALLRRACVGSALVCASALLRSVVKAVFWIRPAPVPTRVFARREEALAHAIQELEGVNRSLPPALQELRRQVTKLAVS